jgi:hypothetical protein
MTRSLLTTISALAVVGACLPPEPSERDTPDASHGAALVGRLRFHDRVLDLTLEAFGSAPDAVPFSSYAEIMADTTPAERPSVESGGYEVRRRGRSH